jgi:putative ABC transport system permease protein
LRNLTLHKLRSLLTALGIIFGVAAVICMLSINEGAAADEMRLIELLGTNNIIVQSVKPEQSTRADTGRNRMIRYGITRRDLSIIRTTLSNHIDEVIPLREVAYWVNFADRKKQVPVVGTSSALFAEVSLNILPGGRALVDEDIEGIRQVCVIGNDVAQTLFPLSDPIGETVLAAGASGSVPYRVVGVIAPVQTAGAPARGTQERNFNNEVYIPISTAETRYGDRMAKVASGSREFVEVELSGMYIVVDDIENVIRVSELVKRVFETTHPETDYDIRVPLASLNLAKQKKRRQQWVMGTIAAVSLLVGGIGIMNIMLATVTERTREIGIRRALGAKQRHIIWQFLIETIVLSTVGGIIGVVLGYGAARGLNSLAEWETIVREWTVVISFALSVMIGVFFGMYPAIRAAQLDPIVALRYE